MRSIRKNSFIQGITLIEILLILMVLAILTSVFVRFYFIYTEHPTLTNAQKTLLTIENGMKFYKLDNGYYPTNEQGIAALVSKPTTQPVPQHWVQYLKAVPVDQWGTPYQYVYPGRHRDIDIYSGSPLMCDLPLWLKNALNMKCTGRNSE